MRIVIVDDSAADRQGLMEAVNTALARRERSGTVLEYESGEAFLSAAKERRFDLAFLDVYMGGMSGVEAARALRDFDENCTLVFTTTSTDHALDGYRVRALQYLVKPYTANEVEQVFSELDKRLPPPEKAVEVRKGRSTVSVRLSDILWAGHFQHQIHIHRRDGGELLSRMTFGEFTALLAGDDRFFVCGRGVLVNLSHAVDFDGTIFTLESGVSVPVSRSMAESARKAFAGFLFQKGAKW